MRWLVTLAFCFSATAAMAQGVPASTQGQLLDQVDMAHAVQRAYLQRDFARLSQMAREFRETKARTSNGGWKLRWFHHYVSAPRLFDAFCSDLDVRFADEWIRAHPEEPAAYIAKASAVIRFGWCFRGEGAASTVTPERARRFDESIAQARKVLEGNKSVASADPHFYATMTIIFKTDGTGAEELMELLDEATAREPLYHQTYIEAAGYFTTIWRGQPGDLRRLTDYALAKTKDEGLAIYPRIFWNYYDCDCFHRSDLDWSVLRRGMLDMLTQFPDDYTASNFARIACNQHDFRAVSALLNRLTGPDTGIGWASGNSWQSCRQMAESDRENRELRKSHGLR